MIGQVIRLYCQGVRDARAGEKRPARRSESTHNRVIYLLGYNDERERMRREQRLDQLRLDLGEPDANGS